MGEAMTLKYSDKPQLSYGRATGDDWRGRFPADAQPIATAPERSATAVLVYEPNGQGHWAMHYSGAWRKVAPFKDWRTGSISWRMDGTEVNNPVAWSMPRRK
jgi:hypothetical protein